MKHRDGNVKTGKLFVLHLLISKVLDIEYEQAEFWPCLEMAASKGANTYNRQNWEDSVSIP